MDPELQRKSGSEIFNFVWTLLERSDRSQREDDLMLHGAHASRFLWEEPGEPVNHARGEWQVSRVYAVLGRGEPALFHAQRCLDICEEHGIGDFDLAYAYEALARASSVAGDSALASKYKGQARAAAEKIADPEDREHLAEDLDSLT
jgi:hypothetical protein